MCWSEWCCCCGRGACDVRVIARLKAVYTDIGRSAGFVAEEDW